MLFVSHGAGWPAGREGSFPDINSVAAASLGVGFTAMFIDVRTEIAPPSACHDSPDLFLSLAVSWGCEAPGKLVTVKLKLLGGLIKTGMAMEGGNNVFL